MLYKQAGPESRGEEKKVSGAEEDWTLFESKGAKKLRERTAVAIEVTERKAVRAARQEGKLFRIEAKKKAKAARKRSSKKRTDQVQLVQQPPAPITLKEYIPGEWFEIPEEDEEDEEVVRYSCQMITVGIDFQERSVKITQDDHARNNTIMQAHNLDGDRTRVTTEI